MIGALASSSAHRPASVSHGPIDLTNLVISTACSVAIALICMGIEPACEHWFVIPVVLCGILTGLDALKWIQGRVDVFDPIGLLGLLGWHVFFLAPLLHFVWDFWMPWVVPPPDWQPWVTQMAWLNLGGWLIYLIARNGYELIFPLRPAPTVWSIEPRRFSILLAVTLTGSGLLQVAIYAMFGGLGGYMETFTHDSKQFVGYGWLFMFAEVFPITALFGVVYKLRQSRKPQTWLALSALFLGFFVLKFFFGGLRGIRGHTIYAVFWGVGVVHLMLRPIPKKLLGLGVVLIIGFMYVYLFYKSFGADALQAMQGDSTAQLEKVHRSFAGLALGDLGRTDVQAYLLYRDSPESSDQPYDYAWGKTYLGAVSLLIPESLYPDRPPSKIKFGHEALFGAWSYGGELTASNAYGIVGEAMLNFGIPGIPVAFAVMGVITAVTRRGLYRYQPGDSRRLMTPFVISLSLMIFMWDSDIVFFYIITAGAIPATLIILSSNRTRLRQRTPWQKWPAAAGSNLVFSTHSALPIPEAGKLP